ncbi:hypothetical protein PC116_g20588 [Phytophthora cactorum]|uniref:Uncharacterized protein n=1 Tax=Phytophthora cactorum TaxID=29920 RepID=A0A8T1B491_9STRA|nr:hypothetical protein PC114_g26332 [Phytophthora cactorum]KAG2896178.1 hypothetical protein PC117_g23068 [Phytophthora cactorum]KAG2969309.1 hypothetical protein PC119_g23956 [Phytophthora cactorum]KAG3124431.1 hypothetical protein C6341_g26163 [Phytophthora cactorum]KAG4041587.1 hypothetical protein PC123_g22898 [Phytophthora cactorum]
MLPSVFHTDELSMTGFGASTSPCARFFNSSAWDSATESLDFVAAVPSCALTEVVVPDVAVSAGADSCAGVFVGELIAK